MKNYDFKLGHNQVTYLDGMFDIRVPFNTGRFEWQQYLLPRPVNVRDWPEAIKYCQDWLDGKLGNDD